MRTKLEIYKAPALNLYSVVVEQGFAQSLGGNIGDYTPGTDDSFDD
jgi:hypothetical protein